MPSSSSSSKGTDYNWSQSLPNEQHCNIPWGQNRCRQLPWSALGRAHTTPCCSSQLFWAFRFPGTLMPYLSLHYPERPPQIPLRLCCYYLFIRGASACFVGTYLDVPDRGRGPHSERINHQSQGGLCPSGERGSCC